MKLFVRIFHSPLLDRLIHVLCDEHGNVLPNQQSVTVRHDEDGSEVTVSFSIDGKRVSVSQEPPAQA